MGVFLSFFRFGIFALEVSTTFLSKGVPLSGRAEGLVPVRADGVQERRIDNQLAERVDQGHVDRREATDAANVNAEVEAIRISRFYKGA